MGRYRRPMRYRGPVLSVFDGKTWRAADRPADAWRRQLDSLRTDGPAALRADRFRIPVLPAAGDERWPRAQ